MTIAPAKFPPLLDAITDKVLRYRPPDKGVSAKNRPYYPRYTCPACNGDGWIVVEYEPVTEDDLEAFYDA